MGGGDIHLLIALLAPKARHDSGQTRIPTNEKIALSEARLFTVPRACARAVKSRRRDTLLCMAQHVGTLGLRGDQLPGCTLRWDVELRAGPVEWGGLLGVLIIKEEYGWTWVGVAHVFDMFRCASCRGRVLVPACTK